MASVEQYINLAAQQIGNNGTKYNMWYWGYTQPAWCATSQSWIAAQLGMTEFKSAACSTMYSQIAQKTGDMSLANVQRGDMVFFNWDGRTSKGWMDHVGVVEWINKSNGQFGTLEGNTSNTFARRTRTIHGGYFVCFARPKYDGGTPNPTPTPTPIPPSGYTTGTYTAVVDQLTVRTGAGTNYAKKGYSALTANAKASAYADGTLKKGTRMTVSEIKSVGNEVWGLIPSGWVALYYGKQYAVRDGGGTPVPAPAPTPTPSPAYSIGSTYTTAVDQLAVRTGAGTSYRKKAKNELTADGQRNSYADGSLKKSTRFTLQETKNVGSEVWGRMPSGWVAVYYAGKPYATKG